MESQQKTTWRRTTLDLEPKPSYFRYPLTYTNAQNCSQQHQRQLHTPRQDVRWSYPDPRNLQTHMALYNRLLPTPFFLIFQTLAKLGKPPPIILFVLYTKHLCNWIFFKVGLPQDEKKYIFLIHVRFWSWYPKFFSAGLLYLSLIHIWRCRRS